MTVLYRCDRCCAVVPAVTTAVSFPVFDRDNTYMATGGPNSDAVYMTLSLNNPDHHLCESCQKAAILRYANGR